MPIPSKSDAKLQLQFWYIFDDSGGQWTSLAGKKHAPDSSTLTQQQAGSGDQILVTWNVDAAARESETRIDAVLSHILGSSPPDIVFFQELNRAALEFILSDQRIRYGWLSSETGNTN